MEQSPYEDRGPRRRSRRVGAARRSWADPSGRAGAPDRAAGRHPTGPPRPTSSFSRPICWPTAGRSTRRSPRTSAPWRSTRLRQRFPLNSPSCMPVRIAIRKRRLPPSRLSSWTPRNKQAHRVLGQLFAGLRRQRAGHASRPRLPAGKHHPRHRPSREGARDAGEADRHRCPGAAQPTLRGRGPVRQGHSAPDRHRQGSAVMARWPDRC